MPTRHLPLANSSRALSFCRVRSVLKDSWCGLSKCFLAAFLSLGGYVVFYITVQWLPGYLCSIRNGPEAEDVDDSYFWVANL